ncbi:uncharacterized protein LOC127266578 [Andrographis paniculata]|uniref:uncharacterized protein LOC127266578 n=1 Tax=Andrographis paniculata TaxID=175694 RepID=UPI0021E87EBE|nr:uncharacterized protein LOC127266578 [Andrographis paniculata]
MNLCKKFRATAMAVVLLISAISVAATAEIGSSSGERPPAIQKAAFARWLVRRSSWGVLSTLNSTGGDPFGNVMSYSDGNGTGVPYFYLTVKLDPTGAFAVNNPRASLTVAEYALGSCGSGADPQSPLCSKITLSGKMELLLDDSPEAAKAKEYLFKDHPKLSGNFYN